MRPRGPSLRLRLLVGAGLIAALAAVAAALTVWGNARTAELIAAASAAQQRIDLLERFSFRLEIRLRVVIGCVQLCVAHPTPDHGHVDAGRNKVDRSRVPKNVRRDPLLGEGGDMFGGGADILAQTEAKAGCGQRLSISIDEQRFVRSPWAAA